MGVRILTLLMRSEEVMAVEVFGASYNRSGACLTLPLSPFLPQSFYFDRDDVALRHFAEFFKEESHEEREHTEKLIAFQNKRGGRVLLQDVK
eukprot:g23438.t1